MAPAETIHTPQDITGILLVNKPRSVTSHDVVDFVRKKFRIKKVGHAGTLDPLATGLLVILLGRATKKSRELIADDKIYRACIQFGKKTDTLDASGTVISVLAPEDFVLTREMIEEVLPKFIGSIEQTPPMFSAVHHQGKRLYELARKGIEVERQSRTVTIYKLVLRDFQFPRLTVDIHCSKGTYIRTLCEQIGKRLSVPCCLEALHRIGSGQFNVAQALSLDQLKDVSSCRELSQTNAYIPWN